MDETETTAGTCNWTPLNYREGKLLSGIIYFHHTTNFLTSSSSLKFSSMEISDEALLLGVLLLKDSMVSEMDYKRRTNFYNDFLLANRKRD